MSRPPRLLLVTDRTQTRGRPLENVVAECVQAGITHVFLRERDLPSAAYDALLTRIHARTDAHAQIITRAARQDGGDCHLTEHDSLPDRRPSLVGRSVHDAPGIHRARSEGVDYVMAGPFRPTRSKPGYGPSLGAPGLSALVDAARELPVLAVGGVRPADLPLLARAGLAGAAVMGPLMRAADPYSVTREYLTAASAFTTHTDQGNPS